MNLEPIDTSTTAGKAEVMRLAAEGRRVAARWHGREANAWWSPDRPEWDWTKSDYAIIAEPVGPDEVWVVIRRESGAVMNVCDEEWQANKAVERGGSAVRYIRADLAGGDA